MFVNSPNYYYYGGAKGSYFTGFTGSTYTFLEKGSLGKRQTNKNRYY